jgi:biopolymer transport protein ExbB/TolQ
MGNILSGFFQSFGADIYHAAIPIVSNSLISALQAIIIGGVIAGVGLIGYDVLSNKKKKTNVKELAEEVRRQQERDELEQIDRQNSERNEGDDRYTPTNL